MKKKIFLGLGVLAIAIVLSLSESLSKTNVKNVDFAINDLIGMSQAQAEGGNGMSSCRCSALWGGNDGCKVSNWGGQCAPDNTVDCSKYDNNC